MTIQSSLKKLSTTQDEVYSKVCVVRSTSKYFLLIDVEPIDSSLFRYDKPNIDNYIRNVKLSPSASSFNTSRSYKVPRVGSYVIVKFLSKELAFVSLFSELELVTIKANDVKIQLTERVVFDNLDAFNINNRDTNILNIEEFDSICNVTIHNINSILLESNNNSMTIDKDNIEVLVNESSRIAIHKTKVVTEVTSYDGIIAAPSTKTINATLTNVFYTKISELYKARDYGLTFAIVGAYPNSVYGIGFDDEVNANILLNGKKGVGDIITIVGILGKDYSNKDNQYDIIRNYTLKILSNLGNYKVVDKTISDYFGKGVITIDIFNKELVKAAKRGVVLTDVKPNYESLKSAILDNSITLEDMVKYKLTLTTKDIDKYKVVYRSIGSSLPLPFIETKDINNETQLALFYNELFNKVDNTYNAFIDYNLKLYDKEFIGVFNDFINKYIKLLGVYYNDKKTTMTFYNYVRYKGFSFALNAMPYMNDVIRGFTGSDMTAEDVAIIDGLSFKYGNEYFKAFDDLTVDAALYRLTDYLREYSTAMIIELSKQFNKYIINDEAKEPITGITNSYTEYKEVIEVSNSLYDILLDLNSAIATSSVIDSAIPTTYVVSPVIIEKLKENEINIKAVLIQ